MWCDKILFSAAVGEKTQRKKHFASPSMWNISLLKLRMNGTVSAAHMLRLTCSGPCSWTPLAQPALLPWKVSSPERRQREEWHEGEVFSTEPVRIGSGWDDNNKALWGCSQAKILPLRPRSLTNSSHDNFFFFFLLLFFLPTPSSADTQSLCPGGSFDLSQTTRLHHYYRGATFNIRLGRF